MNNTISLEGFGNEIFISLDSIEKIFGIERPPKDAKITKNQFGIHYKYQIEGIYYNIQLNYLDVKKINALLKGKFKIERSLIGFEDNETSDFIAVSIHKGDPCDHRHDFGRIVLKLAHKS